MKAFIWFFLEKIYKRMMNVELEVFLVRFDGDDVVYVKYMQNITRDPSNPDHAISRLCIDNNHLSSQALDAACITHSTSWSYRERGSVILTYVIYSDFMHFRKFPGNRIPFSDLSFSFKSLPKSVLGEDILEKDTLAHGLRHLGYLVQNDQNGIGGVLTEDSLRKFKEIDISLGGKLD